jgi:glutathione S-transferase
MRLLGFSYSPYVVKVRKCLELKGTPFTYVEVPYLDRRELVGLTGGSVHVPVLEDAGTVVTDSAAITAWLDERHRPSLRTNPMAVVVEGWADQVFEDTAFRIACPPLEPRMPALLGDREDARALWRLLKERKFGPGCLEAWARDAEALNARAARLLAPLAQAVDRHPFLLGDAPDLADAAVYGQLAFLELAVPGWIRKHAPALAAWFGRVATAHRQ